MSLVALVGAGCQGDRVRELHTELTAEPSSIDFGTCGPGLNCVRELRLRNVSTAAVLLRSAHFEDDGRSAFSIADLPADVGAAQEVSFRVSYAGQPVAGADTAVLVIESDASLTPVLRIPLVARSVAVAADGGTDAGEEASDAGGDGGVDAGSPTWPAPNSSCAGAEDVFETLPFGPLDGGWEGFFPSDIAFDGQRLVVAFDSAYYRDGGAALAQVARIGPDAGIDWSSVTPLDPPSAPATQGGTRLAFNGSEFGAVFLDQSSAGMNVHFTRISAAGTPVGPVTAVPASSTCPTCPLDAPMIAWNSAASQWGVAWTVLDPGMANGVEAGFARFDSTGALVPGSHLQFGGPNVRVHLPDYELMPFMISVAEEWWLTLVDEASGEDRTVRISAAGAVLNNVARAPISSRASFASDGTRVVLGTVNEYGTYSSAAFTFLDGTGALVAASRREISPAGVPTIASPILVWAGNEWRAVWISAPNASVNVSDERHVWTARITSDGEVVPGSVRQITCSPELESYVMPIWTGDRLAIWVVRDRSAQNLYDAVLLLVP